MWPFRSNERSQRQLAELRRDHDQLRADFDALRAQHLSLRGRVYALWGKEKPQGGGDADAASPSGSSSPGAPPPARRTKDELRALAGIKPGKPFPHRDDKPTEETS